MVSEEPRNEDRAEGSQDPRLTGGITLLWSSSDGEPITSGLANQVLPSCALRRGAGFVGVTPEKTCALQDPALANPENQRETTIFHQFKK